MRLSLPSDARFSNKQIFIFLLPVFIEQLIIAGMGLADTYMVANIGESAVAGVSLVSSVDKFIRQIFTALAAGGSVVLSQYLGAEDAHKAEDTLRNIVHTIFAIGLMLSAVMLIFRKPILSFLFGAAEPAVMEASEIYLICLTISYPFTALYNAGTAAYRAMGNSRIPMIASLSMMAVNILLKYIFIFILNWGVAGAGLSTMLGTGIVGIVMVLFLCRPKNLVYIHHLFCFRYDFSLIGRIFKVSIPNAIEGGMFQFGLVVLQGLISTLGTAAIAANGVANNVAPLVYCLSTSFSMVLMVIVGQCMGAGRADEAEMYIKHVLKIEYLCMLVDGVVIMLSVNALVSLFGLSNEAAGMAREILHVYIVVSMILYVSSFSVAYGLRGAGDTKFVMIVSVGSMFLLRIGAAYLFVSVFRAGVMGIWYAQALDWLARSVMFWARFLRGKWKKIKII